VKTHKCNYLQACVSQSIAMNFSRSFSQAHLCYQYEERKMHTTNEKVARVKPIEEDKDFRRGMPTTRLRLIAS